MKNKRFIRIIPRLDIKNGQLIKGINLEGLRILGDPFDFAKFYYESGADEICYVDNVATLYGTNNLTKFVSKTAKNIFVPITVGGGIRTLEDIEKMLRAGADKVCINSSAIDNKNFIKKAAKVFGSSTISAILEFVKINNKHFITKSNGRDIVKKHPCDWATYLEDQGAGEIILTSVLNEGLSSGFETNITKKISSKLSIPVIAHGGAGSFKDVHNIIKNTSIKGVAIASLFHYSSVGRFKYKKTRIGNFHFIENNIKKLKKENYINDLKKYLIKKKINVRI